MYEWRQSIQHNVIQRNDTQHNDIQNNDTQHNNKNETPGIMALGIIMLSRIYAECRIILL